MDVLRTLTREVRMFALILREPDTIRLTYLAALKAATACMPRQGGSRGAPSLLSTRVPLSSALRAGRTLTGWQVRHALSLSSPPPPVVVSPSRVGPGSGKGIFVREGGGAVLPGQLVALYPGALFAGQTLHCSGQYADSSQSDDRPDPSLSVTPPSTSSYRLMRPDGVLLDAGDVATPAGLARAVEVTPWALAHIVQHPPSGQEPNVVEVNLSLAVLRLHPDGSPASGGEGRDAPPPAGHAAGVSTCASVGEALALAGDVSSIPRPWLSVDHLPALPYWWPPEPVLSGVLPRAAMALPLLPTVDDLYALQGLERMVEQFRVQLSGALGGQGTWLGRALASPAAVRRVREAEVHADLTLMVVPVTVLIAVKRIQPGEEVLFDYGFLPEGAAAKGGGSASRALPPWYTRVDPQLWLRLEAEVEAAIRSGT